jgi:glycine cleavage system aminomethyltransferase T/glycine/D-amino acid oxidase-like deaminating enzyme
MSSGPTRASTVIIGAGIVGNSLACHLARLGWRDLVLVDKGPMPSPGGSTGHASNFIFPMDYSKMMTELTRDSADQYRALGVHIECGGIELARTVARLEEQKRKASAARSWQVPAERLSPAEVGKLVPYVDQAVVLGGLYFPTVGVVRSVEAGTLMRQGAVDMGALEVRAEAEVLAIDVVDGRVRAVQTTSGDIETEVCAICCGVWSPRLARMAGARIPLTPAVHQMVCLGPVPFFAGTAGEISYPVVRDVDTSMYERQKGEDIQVGSYAHRPITIEPDEIPSIEKSLRSPTELPFTRDDFRPQLEQARELMPDLLGGDHLGTRYEINGLIAMTPDGHPVLGEAPEVKGLWSVAASWVKEGPGIGRAVAEWMSGSPPEIDVHEANISRFYDHQKSRRHVRTRAREGFNKMYGIVHPAEQWEQARPSRRSPFYGQARELGAVFFETAGWERPHWYRCNEGLLEQYGDRVMPRTAEWDARWWSPVINAEHLAMRAGCGALDLSAFAILDVMGPGALACLQSLTVAPLDVAVGRVVYTSMLDEKGGFVADLTVMRLGTTWFRIVTGGATGMADKKWVVDHLPGDGTAQLADLTSAVATIGLWGPNARRLLQRICEDDLSHDAFPFATCRAVEVAGTTVLASRISYVGELGWELHVPTDQGGMLWDAIFGAEGGQGLGLVPVGIGVYGSTGRLEKGYRAYGAELTADFNLVEAGMARPRVKEQGFIGRAAYLEQRERGPVSLLCTLTVDDHTSSTGERRYMLGGEPILTLAGEPLVDPLGRASYVTSAGSGPSVGRHLLMAYLPLEHALVGTKLAVEYMSERYPVTVAVVGPTPLFDPGNERVRSVGS